MSDGDRGELLKDRGRLVAAGIVALVAIAAYWAMFYSMGYASGQRERKANVESEHYASTTAEQIERECSAKSGPAARECITKIVDSERESQRGESDLAAQWKAADWVMWAGILAGLQVIATLVGLYYVRETLRATLEAVEDTSKATVAMERQNEIALDSQRAWVTLKAIPKLVRRDGLDGLYMRVDFAAENTGGSAATHFDLESKVLFMPQGASQDFGEVVEEQVAKWRDEHSTGRQSYLLPRDTETTGIWDAYTADQIHWWQHTNGAKASWPILLCAALYRTAIRPDHLQVAWRTWYLHKRADDGQALSYLPLPKDDLGPDKLCVEVYHGSMNHWEHETGEQRAGQVMGRHYMAITVTPRHDEPPK